MAEAIGWIVAAVAGALLSALYFAGLWWTVRRVPYTRHPATLIAVSFLVRAALAAGALWLVIGGDVVRLLAALGAFLLVRTAVLWRVRVADGSGIGDQGSGIRD